MKYNKSINNYQTVEDYNSDKDLRPDISVSLIKEGVPVAFDGTNTRITFSDPEVRSIILEKMGTETPTLSQVREITNFFGWFNNKPIVTFNELKRFTGLTNLGDAFSGCTLLEEVSDIPKGVTNMDSTFNSCSSLVSFPIIPEGVINMSDTFSNCRVIVGFPIVPESVTSLHQIFFTCQQLHYVQFNHIIPPTYSYSLYGCNVIRNIYVPDESVTLYKEAEGWSNFVDKIFPISHIAYLQTPVTFSDPEVRSVILEKMGTETPTLGQVRETSYIGGWFSVDGVGKPIISFNEFSQFTDIKDMSTDFQNCESLKELIFPENVTSLNETFFGCSSLEEIFIPKTINNLSWAFRNCSSLKVVQFEHTTPPYYNEIFLNCPSLTHIYVPDESVTLYKEAEGWSEFVDRIFPSSSKPTGW